MRVPHASRPLPPPARVEPVALKATYLNRRGFLSQTTVGAERCGLEVPGAPALASGTPVHVRLEFLDQVMVFELDGTVARSAAGRAFVEVTGAALGAFGRAFAFARGLPMGWGRRGHERVEVSLPMHLYTADGQLARATTEDASRGGFRVRAQGVRLHAGQVLRFVARLGLLRRVRGTARVAWATPSRAGIVAGLELQTVETADRLTLAAFLLERRAAR